MPDSCPKWQYPYLISALETYYVFAVWIVWMHFCLIYRLIDILKSDPSLLFGRRVFVLIYRSIILSIIEFYCWLGLCPICQRLTLCPCRVRERCGWLELAGVYAYYQNGTSNNLLYLPTVDYTQMRTWSSSSLDRHLASPYHWHFSDIEGWAVNTLYAISWYVTNGFSSLPWSNLPPT